MIGSAPELIGTPLIRGAQIGDECAIAELLRLSRPLAARAIGRQFGDGQSVDDLVQTTLLIVLTELSSLRAPEAYIGWLQGIVRNVCCKELRRRESARQAAGRLAQRDLSASTGLVDPLDEALRGEVRSHLESALRRLPGRYQVAMLMRACEERTYDEIGEALGVPGHLARLWYFRARQRLQDACRSDEVLRRASSRPNSDFLIELSSCTVGSTERLRIGLAVADRGIVACGAA
jgi:RNA polymerase sigma-70 factor (ECF subfamily)